MVWYYFSLSLKSELLSLIFFLSSLNYYFCPSFSPLLSQKFDILGWHLWALVMQEVLALDDLKEGEGGGERENSMLIFQESHCSAEYI